MKKLSVVISVLNQIEMSKQCYMETYSNCSDNESVEFIIIDNGSDTPITEEEFPNAKIVRNNENIGVYPTFKQGMEIAESPIVAFLHSDVVVWEIGWDKRVVDLFNEDKKTGMIGFIGSNEIDGLGGRGLGTASNFQGRKIGNGSLWQGSPAEVHGGRISGKMKSAVVDGCVMVLSKKAWKEIGYRNDFPIHHFYDRLISTQLLEKGFSIYTLGIEFDHISGQTVNTQHKYSESGLKWLKENGKYTGGSNIDQQIYWIAEKMWLDEYRDKKHLVPLKV